MSRRPYVFVSYATDVSAYAEAIKKRLVTRFGIVTDPSLLSNDVEEEIRNAEIVIVILSEAASNSNWVHGELAIALRHNRHLIPVLLDVKGTQSALMSLVGDRQIIDGIGLEPNEVANLVVSRVPTSAVKLSKGLTSKASIIGAACILFGFILILLLPYYNSVPPDKAIMESEQVRSEIGSLQNELQREKIELEKTRLLIQIREEKTEESQRLVFEGIQFSQHGQLTEAIDLYEKAIIVDPRNPVAHQLLGYNKMRRSQLTPGAYPEDSSEAVSSLEKAIALDPRYVWGHYNLALARWNAGFKIAAAESVRTLLDIDPSFITTIREDSQFKRLLESVELKELIEQ